MSTELPKIYIETPTVENSGVWEDHKFSLSNIEMTIDIKDIDVNIDEDRLSVEAKNGIVYHLALSDILERLKL